jgi:hypothetical protein
MKNQQICVLGAGGHGIQSLDNVLNNHDYQINICYPPADYGGATGSLVRLMDSNNGELSNQIFQRHIPNLPWGDCNKIIAHWIGVNYPQCQHHFLARCNTLEQVMYHFNHFNSCIKLDHMVSAKFAESVLAIYSYPKDKGIELKSASVAHFFNYLIFAESGSMEGYNKTMKSLGIIPDNCSLHFLTSERIVLHGIDANGTVLRGEDIIDNHLSPIHHPSLVLTNPDNSEISQSQISQLLIQLENADCIILPNGSTANYLPILHIESVRQICARKATEGKLFLMMNLFYRSNEHKIYTLLEYIKKHLSIDVIVLGPKLGTHLDTLNEDLLHSYSNEGKLPNSIIEVARSGVHYIAWFDLIHGPDVEGLKYDTRSVFTCFKLLVK